MFRQGTLILLIGLFCVLAGKANAELFGWFGRRNRQHNSTPPQNQGPQGQNPGGRPTAPPNSPTPRSSQQLLSQENLDLLRANVSPADPYFAVIPVSCLENNGETPNTYRTFVFQYTGQPGNEAVMMKEFPDFVPANDARALRQMMASGATRFWQDPNIPRWGSAESVVTAQQPLQTLYTMTSWPKSQGNPGPTLRVLLGTTNRNNPRPNRELKECVGPAQPPAANTNENEELEDQAP
jgi:hypothetical protein